MKNACGRKSHRGTANGFAAAAKRWRTDRSISALNQKRMKTSGPNKLTSLAEPMMFNDNSAKISGHKWCCGREAAVWTKFSAVICGRFIILGSRSDFGTMLPLSVRPSIELQSIGDHLDTRSLQSPTNVRTACLASRTDRRSWPVPPGCQTGPSPLS